MSINILKKINKTTLNGENINVYNKDDLTTQYIYGTIKSLNDTEGSITALRGFAFTGCSYLESVVLNASFSSLAYTFVSCERLKYVQIPNVMRIETAFSRCSNLLTVEIPNCTSIGASAFLYCSNLSTVLTGSLTFIGNATFSGCNNFAGNGLNTQNVTAIGTSAFGRCSNLSKISLPNCSSLGSNAFAYCINLSAIVLMSTSVTKIQTNTFTGTPMIASSYLGYYGSIYVPASMVGDYQSATNWASLSSRITSVENLQ